MLQNNGMVPKEYNPGHDPKWLNLLVTYLYCERYVDFGVFCFVSDPSQKKALGHETEMLYIFVIACI